MDPRERIYDLLVSYWESSANGFVAAWCQGLSVEETARRLDADLDSATPCSFKNYTRGLNESHGMWDGVILVKQVGAWVHVLQPYMIHAWHDDALQALSRDGGRALNIGWHSGGAERLTYMVDGRIVANMPLTAGDVPAELEPYAHGLRFGCEDPTDPECENPEDPITDTESIASAFVIAGRITGRELDRELLDAMHTRYLIRD
ncbi:DUF6461 domain-containing protein [Streptosporangium sp. NPDC006013]|uniref:DUF6461 domain-containing protein n=1 Tax=Streptosporangium sp. NPDC006013 TaxID=3155596 RepID=UPI0033A7EDC3